MQKFWQDLFIKNIDNKKKNDLYRSFKILKSVDGNDEYNGREIEISGKKLINFASNDYLGLTHDDRILKAGYDTARKYGNGSGASRLITGTFESFITIENMLSEWAGKEKALIFNSGYQANAGLISSLADKDTYIFSDKLNHASIYDGIILSRANMIRFPHRDIKVLEKQLEKHRDKKKKILITDSVFSMDGDIAPLKEMVQISKKHNALIIIDEAHSFGIYGNHGNGLANKLELTNEIDIIMGTLGKSFGVFGAFILSGEITIDYLINNSRAFIFSTALPPFVIGSIIEALKIIQTEDRGRKVLELAGILRNLLHKEGINIANSESQIIPIIVNENKKALSLMNHLNENGFFASAIRPPTVPENTSRVRLSVTYNHSLDDINNIFNSIKKWHEKEMK